MVSRQEPSSPERPSSWSRSGIAGIGQREPERRVPRSPSGEMFGHRRPVVWPPRLATGQAARLPRGIVRVSQRLHRHADDANDIASFAVDQVAADLAPLTYRMDLGASFAAGLVAANAAIRECRHDTVRLRHRQRGCNKRVRCGHLGLHQRAPLPFRCLHTRAIGPFRQVT